MVDYSRMAGDPLIPSSQLTDAARAAMASAFPVRWGAIASGVVIALVVQILLSLLGVALGFSALMFVSPEQDITAPATSAFWWWAISGIIAAFCGGVIAGATTSDRVSHAGVNAFIAWATATVLMVALSGVAGGALAQGAAFGGPLAYVSEQLANAGAGQVHALRELVVTLSFWSVIALLIGAAAAVGGGRLGFNWSLAKQPGGVY